MPNISRMGRQWRSSRLWPRQLLHGVTVLRCYGHGTVLYCTVQVYCTVLYSSTVQYSTVENKTEQNRTVLVLVPVLYCTVFVIDKLTVTVTFGNSVKVTSSQKNVLYWLLVTGDW